MQCPHKIAFPVNFPTKLFATQAPDGATQAPDGATQAPDGATQAPDSATQELQNEPSFQ